MQILLCAVDPLLHKAWEQVFLDTPLHDHCHCVQGNILSLHVDAVVSPANSFGFMDGGIDGYYTQIFGPQVQARLQAHIRSLPFAELLVGQAVGIATDHPRIPWCICAPTMRVPMLLHNATPAYLATRAAVAEALRLGLNSIAIPGMGTGTGGLPALWAAQAMRDGVRDGLAPRDFPQGLYEVPSYCDV